MVSYRNLTFYFLHVAVCFSSFKKSYSFQINAFLRVGQDGEQLCEGAESSRTQHNLLMTTSRFHSIIWEFRTSFQLVIQIFFDEHFTMFKSNNQESK